VGAVLLQLTVWEPVVPLAAWLAPVFLLRFVRTQRPVLALSVIALLGYVSALVALRGSIPAPGVYLFALAGLATMVAYGADRLLAWRIGGLVGTLVFPATDTALSFLSAIASRDFATFGAAAYTQASELVPVQLVSVTGLWGLGFLIAWLAPVANDLWEHGFDPRQVRRGTTVFAAVLAAVLLFGGVRLAFFPPAAPSVRVAGLAPDRALSDAAEAAPLGPRPLPAAARTAARQRYLEPLAEDLLARTRQAARGGAKIVAWSEAAAFVFKEDEAALVQRARAVARQERIYLQVGLVSLLPTDRYPAVENRAILFDPAGALVWDYPKATEVLGDGNRPGPGIVPTVDTPYGRLATVICFDADFPRLVRQAGKARADILLVPSSDWKAVAEVHSRMAVFRAVENGVALVRPTRKGTSLASDHQGRLLGYKRDYFVGADHTMVVNVPTRGTPTLYARLGDGVGWLCVLGLLALPLMALARRRRPPATRTRSSLPS
jgi:apolipoprotein N-acyltransferase